MKRIILFSSLFIFSCNHIEKNTTNIIKKKVDSSEYKTLENLCNYKNPTKLLGVGVLEWKPDLKCQISILDHNKQKSIATVDYCLNTSTNNICPIFYKPDYGIIHFIVLEEQINFYKIIYNYNQIRYVDKKESFNYKNWKNYLLDLPLGAKLKSNNLNFKILDVKEDSLLRDDFKWIKWRNKNNDSLYLDFNFLM